MTDEKQDDYKPKRRPDGTYMPGYSGCPKGPGKGARISTIMRRHLAEHPEDEDKIKNTLIGVALNPQHKRWSSAMKMLIELVQGLPARQVNVSMDDSPVKRIILASSKEEIVEEDADPEQDDG